MVAFNKEKFLKNAQKYVASGKLDYAIKEYEKVLEQEPTDTNLMNTIGDLNLSLGRNQVAIDYFKRAAKRFIDEGFYGRAVAVYRKIVRANPNSLENTEALADLFMKEGVVNEAKKHYAELGRLYLQQNNFTKAYQIFKKLGDLTQDDPNIHLKLAELSIKLEMLENARESYLNAAVICSRKGNHQQSMNAITMALEIDPNHLGSLRVLFKISLELRDYQLLQENLRNALARTPNSLELMEMLGQCYMFSGNLDDSLVILSNLYEADESRSRHLADLADTACRVGSYNLGVEAMWKIAPSLLARKEQFKIQEFLKAVIEKDPRNTKALARLAEVYFSTNDNFNHFTIMDKLGDLLMEQKNYAEALPVVEKLLSLDSGSEKYRGYHRLAFENVYPQEAYAPIGDEAEEQEDLSSSIFEMDTSELSSGQAFAQAKESDSGLEIELLLSYGLKDKAKTKLLDKIQTDPNDTVFREKLKNIYREEGNLKQAADLCFEMATLLNLRGEHEKAEMFLDEGRGLDPSRSDVSAPTAVLENKIDFPDEMDTSNFGFETLDLEPESIDLTNDLSEILVGESAEALLPPVEAKPAPPAERPAPFAPPLKKEPAKPAPPAEDTIQLLDIVPELVELPAPRTTPAHRPVEPLKTAEPPAPAPPKPAEAKKPAAARAPMPDIDTDINLRLEETLKSIQDLGLDDMGIFSSLGLSKKPAAPPKPAEPPPVLEIAAPPPVAKKETPPPVKKESPAAAPPKPEPPPAEDASLYDVGLLDFSRKIDLEIHETKEANIPAAEDKDLSAALQEIDFYIKLGFLDNAREELNKLSKTHANHPDIKSRLQSVGPGDTKAAPASPAAKAEEDIIPPPTIEVREIAPPGRSTPVSTIKLEASPIEDVTADDVNIDLFNMISTEQPEDAGRPSSSYEVRKNIPVIDPPPAPTPAPAAPVEESDNIFGDIEAESLIENAFLFSGDKSSPAVPAGQDQGFFMPKENEEKRFTDTDKKISAMHNIFSDIVEEANKVFVSDEVDDTDFDTHYNLGIAYKEMMLLDDAISEFQKAFNIVKDQISSPSFIKACHILNVCFFEKGLYRSAVKCCERGLNSVGHESHEYQALRYDMARAYEMLQEYKQALDIYAEIYAEDIHYRDVTEKIDSLKKQIN